MPQEGFSGLCQGYFALTAIEKGNRQLLLKRNDHF